MRRKRKVAILKRHLLEIHTERERKLEVARKPRQIRRLQAR